jgi:hypothetical protein
MKKTNKEVIQFINLANNLLARYKEKNEKFAYALRKVVTRATKWNEGVVESEVEINIKYAAEDERTKLILRNARGEFEYTREGLINRNKDVRELLKKEAEVEHHYVTELPTDLSEDEIEVLTGFVISDKPRAVANVA